MSNLWNRCREDILTYVCTSRSTWDSTDPAIRDTFLTAVREDGMEEALLNTVRNLRLKHGADALEMFNHIVTFLTSLGPDDARTVVRANSIRFFAAPLQYLIESADDTVGSACSTQLEPTNPVGPCSSDNIQIKAWLVDRLWGLLDQQAFRKQCILDSAAASDPHEHRWLVLTQHSRTLTALCA